MRETYSCTLLIDGDRVEKLNTKTDQTLSPLVYPSWHPSGKYVAFSVNKTKQAFHMNDRNRVEVFDWPRMWSSMIRKSMRCDFSAVVFRGSVRDFPYIFPGWKYALFLFG